MSYCPSCGEILEPEDTFDLELCNLCYMMINECGENIENLSDEDTILDNDE